MVEERDKCNWCNNKSEFVVNCQGTCGEWLCCTHHLVDAIKLAIKNDISRVKCAEVVKLYENKELI